jgi:lipid-A-disaccharide synthase
VSDTGEAGAAGRLDIFLVAAEASGDRLGAALIRALRARAGDEVRFAGIGGPEMAAQGVPSLYPIEDLAIIGFAAIPRRLPTIIRLLRLTAKAVVARRPRVLVIIDSPAFSCRVAQRVRKAAPDIAVVEYVSPSVWAWRPGRARALKAYVDHILALLPFEPEVHRRLGGPPCSYVGHPLADEVGALRPNPEEARRRLADPPVLLVLPGSRPAELRRLVPVFGETVTMLRKQFGELEPVVATVPHLRDAVAAATAAWNPRPRIVVETAQRHAAMRAARAALAKSGTVTLELALAGVPMVAAYKVSPIEYALLGRRILRRLPSIILANLLLGENVVPELLQHNCTPQKLTEALLPLLADTPARRAQVDAFARLDAIMEIGTRAPAARAADIVLALARSTPATHA